MKRASVYLRKTAIYLHSESETIEGAWVASAPFIKVEMDASDIGNRLELAVTTVLVNSSHEVPHPKEWNLLKPLYLLSNVKSWNSFAIDGCKLVVIETDGEQIKLLAYDNRNPEHGFVNSGKLLILSALEQIDWQRRLTDAFALCT